MSTPHLPEPPQNDHDLLISIWTTLQVFVKKSDDHESRLRALERKVFVATGAAGTLGGAAGYLLGLVGR